MRTLLYFLIIYSINLQMTLSLTLSFKSMKTARFAQESIVMIPRDLSKRNHKLPLSMMRNSINVAQKLPSNRFLQSIRYSMPLSVQSIRNDPWYIWTILSITSSIGIVSEKTNIGAAISSPLITTLLTMLLCNIGFLPSESKVYTIVLKVLVPLAIPLLLLDADIKKCFKKTGSLLKAFIIGSIGTIIGTIVAYMLVPMKKLPGASSIASALCARHIGGAVNFVAVTEVLSTPADVVAAALAADNVIVAIYFLLLFSITTSGPIEKKNREISELEIVQDLESTSPVNLLNISLAMSLSLVLYTISHMISLYSKYELSPILIVSLLVISIATLFPQMTGKLSKASGIVGVLFMQLFFAVIGSMGHIPTVLRMAPALFLHTTIQIIVHFFFSVLTGKLFNISFNETVLASNANVGGPTTAAAMASSKRWQSLILPALLTGVFGYAIATIIGVGISRVLPMLPTL